MPQIVDVLGVGEVEFPDEFSDEMMKEALDREYGRVKEATEPRSIQEQRVRESLGGPFGPVPRSSDELAAQNFLGRKAIGMPEEGIPGTVPIDEVLPGGVRMQKQPLAPLPTFTAPEQAGAIEQTATGAYNLLAGLGNFMASPEGIATAFVPGLVGPRLAKPVLGAIFAPPLTKAAAQLAGEASVTGRPQTWTEAIGTGLLGLGTGFHARTLPKTLTETARSLYAARKGIIPKGGQPEYPGTAPERVSTETGDRNRLVTGPEVQQAQVPQEGPAGVLLNNRPAVKLMPEEGQEPQYIEAQQKADGTWETHDEIINRNKLSPDMIDRRVFLDQQGNEKLREQTAQELAQQGMTTKVPGEAHSTDVNKLAGPREPEIPEEIQALIDAGKKGLEHEVEIVPETAAGEADPFAATRKARGQLMGAHLKSGKIQIYPREFLDWLRQDVRPEQWSKAIRARLHEESIHLKTLPADALKYWKALSGIEKYAEQRIYLGKGWRQRMARGEFSPQELGFEAIRRRMQRLARMESSEVAETAGREKWTVQSLQVLGDAVRGIRESFGTKASAEQLRIINKMLGNIDAAKAAVSGAAQPAAARRRADEIDSLLKEMETPETIAAGGTNRATQAGLKATSVEDLDALADAFDRAKQVPKRLMAAGDLNAAMRAAGSVQLPREAIEAAVNAGSNTVEMDLRMHGGTPKYPTERPLDWRTHPEVADWLVRNAKRLGINLPEELAAQPAAVRREVTPLDSDVIWKHLASRHNIKKGGAVQLYNDPAKAQIAELLFDQNRKPSHIRINQAKIGTPKELDWTIEHEASHWYDLENFDTAGKLQEQLTNREWESVFSEVTKLGYSEEAIGNEITARGIQVLAESWRGRGWFDRMVGHVQRFAAETIGLKMTRRAAESTAVRAIAQSIKRISKAGPVLEPHPAGVRREKAAEKATREMFLPPVERGQAVEREGFALPTGKQVQDMADVHFQDLSEAPSFEQFKGELESRFGSLRNEHVYQAWQDAMMKRLMTAKGAELDALMDKLGVRPEVAEALKPGERDPMLGRGRIPDAMELPAAQMTLPEINQFFKQRQWKTKAAYRQKFGPEQRRRYAAIGAIVDKLSAEAGPKPAAPSVTATVGPEDVSHVVQVVKGAERMVDETTGAEVMTQPEVASAPEWYAFKPEDLSDPKALGDFSTKGARVSGKKFTVTNNAMAVRGKDGKIYLLSVFKDTRAGNKIVNPQGAGLTARNIDGKFLQEYTPMVLTRLRAPRESLRQVFESQAEFDQHFGDIGIEGTEGVAASSFTGQGAGVAREQAGVTTGAQGIAQEKPLPRPFRRQPPQLAASPEISGARELTLPRFARTSIPRGAIPEALPRPEEPSRFLPEGAIPEPVAETVPMVGKLPYETLPRPTADRPVTEYGHPAPRQPGTEIRAGLEPQLARRAPGAVRRNLADEFEAIGAGMKKMVRSWPTRDQPPRMADSASNRANNIAAQYENHVRLASMKKPTTVGKKLTTAWQKGNPEVLAAANALVEAKAVRPDGSIDDAKRSVLLDFHQRTMDGLAKARAMANGPNWAQRRIGRAWIRNQQNLIKELEYAYQHWGDRDLRETAKRASKTFHEEIALEKSKGLKVSEKTGYDPHRYDAALWDGESYLFELTNWEKKILGRRYAETQKFPSYYHAGEAGPYLAVTRDLASLVGHRVRQGQQRILQDAWKEGLKNVRLPDGRPLAIDPVPGAKRDYLSPKRDYMVVPSANHLAIHQDYAPLIKQLTGESQIELFGPSRALLHLSQELKHSILVGDFFHLGRMLYYGLATMGTRAGYRSGWSVLDIADRDMPEAVRRGLIRQKDMDWARQPVPFGRGFITRRQLAEKFYSQMGANLGRVQDALYKDLLTQTSPTAGKFRRGVVRVIDPSIGRYNRFLFDRLTRGMMAEANVREFERQMKANPNVSPHKLMKDIARDVNNFFGNIGRQGWLKSKTLQDLMRITWLAPQWVEGLIKKEAVGYSRLSGLGYVSGMRRAPQQGYIRQLGTTGMAIGRGLGFMIGLTQALNLIFRRQPTWMNEEKEHRFDAWIPGWGADSEGFWLSPLAIYNELTHDLYRLAVTKPTFADAVAQIAANKEQPVTRALLVGATGVSPLGQKITTTPGRVREMAKAVAPVPISFGRLGQAALSHTGLVSPPPPGSVQRQLFATGGVKIEPAETAVQRTAKLAQEFMEREGLTKDTGWQQVQTDQPGYSKLRSAIRADDWAGAKRNLDALRKTRDDKVILQSMKRWAKAGFTGSRKNEAAFLQSLSDEEMALYDKAQDVKEQLYDKFEDWFWRTD